MRYLLATTTAGLLFFATGSAQAQPRSYDPVQRVQSWYQAYLGRPADQAGLDAWVGQLRYGARPETVQAGILGSDEYYARHGSTPEGFVQGLYADVLGRTSSPRQVYPWVSRLMNYGGDRKQVALDFLYSARAQRPTYPPAPAVYAPGYARVRPYGYAPYGYPPARRWTRGGYFYAVP